MEEFLGILFCGGKGKRLEQITKYFSKSFIPVYDTPVFKFGLKLLENSKLINEILILTNEENDSKLNQLGYRTIIQDYSVVTDMLTGWTFIKDKTRTKKNGVLVPSDNICKTNIDKLIRAFDKQKADFLFSLHKINNKKKLKQMGCYDISNGKYYYKNPNPPSNYGVIAPYIIKNTLENIPGKNIFEAENSKIIFHKGYWFDIGSYESISEASKWQKKNK